MLLLKIPRLPRGFVVLKWLRISISLSFVLFGQILSPPTMATTWDVPSQCPTIQAGIDSASAGDTVLVACGTYLEHDIVMKSSICVRSETGEPECVTIDAQDLGRVITCIDIDNTTFVKGVTITGGHARGDSVDGFGGGMYCCGSSPTLLHCRFSENQADLNGGGMYLHQCSHPILTDVAFVGNTGKSGGGAACSGDAEPEFVNVRFSDCHAALEGGGLHCHWGPTPVLSGCSFIDNSAGMGAGARCVDASANFDECEFSGNIASGGGGVYATWGSCRFTNCVCSVNTAGVGGGFFLADGHPLVRNVSFLHNEANLGGGLACTFNIPTIDECLFSQNRAVVRGGAVLAETHSSPQFAGCVFVGNTASSGGAADCVSNTSPTFTNCTFAGNSGDGAAVHSTLNSHATVDQTIIAFTPFGGRAVSCDDGSSVNLSCCDVFGNVSGDWVDCIEDQYGINGNISEDPLFCDPDNGDYHLDCTSPCAPGYNPECGLIGAWGVGCGATRTEQTTWSSLKALYR